jgi:hypothetical protein
MYDLRTTLSIVALRLCPLGRRAIISLDCCFVILLIGDYVIILLAEEVCGSLGGSLLPVRWGTKYIIIWWSVVTAPVILALRNKPQCEIEGTKEKRTLALSVGMRTHRIGTIRELWELRIIKITIRNIYNTQLYPM